MGVKIAEFLPASWRRFLRREASAPALALAMNLPSLFFLLVVLAYPIAYAGYLSFHRVGLGQIRRGIYPFYGLENFRRLFEDELYWLSMKHTLTFTLVVVPTE